MRYLTHLTNDAARRKADLTGAAAAFMMRQTTTLASPKNLQTFFSIRLYRARNYRRDTNGTPAPGCFGNTLRWLRFSRWTGLALKPYRGTLAAHSALLAGDVHAISDAVPSAMPHIQSVTATARLRVLPDLPPIGMSSRATRLAAGSASACQRALRQGSWNGSIGRSTQRSPIRR